MAKIKRVVMVSDLTGEEVAPENLATVRITHGERVFKLDVNIDDKLLAPVLAEAVEQKKPGRNGNS